MGVPGSGETFADRLEYLFSTVRYRDADSRWRTFTTGEVADLITQDNDRYRVKMSRSYLGMLRSGRYSNPSIAMVIALVRFFNDHRAEGTPEIGVDWLASGASAAKESTPVDEELSPVEYQQVRHIAMRAGKMTPELRNQLIAILDMLDDQK
ncbi:hypothetical protein ACIBCN_41305 [Nocardia sp. NPDC051052]|uniref:hypothetical protein n=1 Tax=Nocardia sp. NPDC051052 TaxID=3364322 RepID=UPI0037B24A00